MWLTERIRGVHQASFGTYGSRRVHAELRLGLGIIVGHGAVELLMRRAGLVGLPGRKRRRLVHDTAFAADLVDRNFGRQRPDELWVTDITEHPTREGKVYCAVVLDVHSRRVVGWSIDATQTAALATNALSMAIANRSPHPDAGIVIHSDHGVQGGFNRSSQHLDRGGVGWDVRRSWVRQRAVQCVGMHVARSSGAAYGGESSVGGSGC